MILTLLGCGYYEDLSEPPPPLPEPPPPFELPPPCGGEPCVTDLASASYEAQFDWPSYAGYALAVTESHLVVGAPFRYTGYNSGTPQTLFLDLLTLQQQGSWIGNGYDNATGAALAAADVDGDDLAEVAVSEASAREGSEGGKVHLLPGQPQEEVPIESAAMLTIVGDASVLLGVDLFFSEDATELVVNGVTAAATEGRILVFSTASRGTLHEYNALRSITAPGPLGTIAPWDGDADGVEDLIVQYYENGSVAWYGGPWGNGPFDAPDLEWTASCTDDCNYGEVIEPLGDVTGDGREDLGISAPQRGEPERAGSIYVLEAIGEGGAIEDSPFQLHGTEAFEDMGAALAGADIDGDGQQDLVTSASGMKPGALLVYRGPLQPGVRTEADADAIVRGQYEGDLFVRAIAVVDIDGDEHEDLAVGAPGWPAGQSQGAVYLLAGAALLP